jgi:hypothetical protein
MALPGTRVSVRPVDLLSAIRFLKFTRAKLSPRALRYEFFPEQDARLVLEPWEHTITLRGAEHGYLEPRVIRTWGRRRLRLIEPLLPFAERVDVYLKGRGMPSFYAVKLPGMTFVLGLSGWSAQRWTNAGLELTAAATPVSGEFVERVAAVLAEKFAVTERDLATQLGESSAVVHAALSRLCRLGRATHDVETRAFRHRELFAEPIDERKMYPPDPRTEQAGRLLSHDEVRIETCESQENRKTRRLKTPDGPVVRTVVYRDWRVIGRAGAMTPVEIVIDDRGQVIFGRCPCAFFEEHLLTRGPCEHMIALHRASESRRQDLPSSYAAQDDALPARGQVRGEEEGDGSEDEGQADAGIDDASDSEKK